MTSPRRLLAERGLAPIKGRGQNFLSSPRTARAITAFTGARPGGRVLEIGPGLGALTRPLLETGARVTVVEVDEGLARYLEEELAPEFPDRLTVVTADALKTDLVAAGSEGTGEPFLVAGNLPYNISTPILLKLLEIRHAVRSAVLMFQKELADRLAARPGTKDYGRLTVLMGYYSKITRLMDIGPEAFHPRPKVGSTVLRVEFKPDPRPALHPDAPFEKTVAAAFSQRRKTLRNALRTGFSAENADQALASAGIDGSRRAETLSVDEFVALANAAGAATANPE